MLTPEFKNVLLSSKLCKYLTKPEFEMIITHSKIVSFAAGDLIIQQGKVSPGIYIIGKGAVLLTAKVLGAGITHISSLTTGSFVGEVCLIEKAPSAISVMASTDIECLLLSSTYFEMLSLFFPETRYKILRAITEEVCERLKIIRPKILEVMAKSKIEQPIKLAKIFENNLQTKELNTADLDFDLKQLNETPSFKFFSDSEFTELLNEVVILQVPKNYPLINEGTKNKAFYIILRGAVQTSMIEKNKLAKLSVLGPMGYFCGFTFVNEIDSSIVNYTTRVDTNLLTLNEVSLIALQKNNINIWYKLYNLVCQSFIDLERAANKLDIRLNSEFYNVQPTG